MTRNSEEKEIPVIQKPALWISVGLTTFMLFTVSSVLQNVSAANASPQSDPVGSSSGLSPEIEALIAERESQYIAMINQANAQLTQAQQALGVVPASNSAATQFSPEQAAEIADASAISGASRTGEPALVNFEGAVAYEVPYDYGNIYIDATTGELIFNGTINLEPSPITAEQAAQIAASYMGKGDVYNVELVALYDQMVFRVKFSNSDAVFVDQYGNILLVRLAPSGGGGNGGAGTEDHEDDHEEDQEDHEDEDHD
jgi:hypothetical protein